MKGRRLLMAAWVALTAGSGCQLIAGYGDSLDNDVQVASDGGGMLADAGRDATVGEGGTADAGSDRADGECLMPTASDFSCTSAEIVKLTGSQTIDGFPDPIFCGITPLVFVAANGVQQLGDSGGIDAVVSLRAAWTTDALHLHAHVEESEVRSELDGGQPYEGDALEFMLTSSDTNLTGTYPDPDPGFRFIVGAPEPDGTVPCQVSISTGANPRSCMGLDYLTAASVDVDGGFDVEARIEWPPEFTGEMVAANAFIRFNVTFDRRAADGGREFQSSFYYEDAGISPIVCSSMLYEPYCDDRTWCRTALKGL